MRNKKTLERRHYPSDGIEIRESESEKIVLSGYFARFNLPFEQGDFTEIIQRGFFRDVVSAPVPAVLNHDSNMVFARQGVMGDEGWMMLEEDEHGLKFKLAPLRTRTIDDLLIAPIRSKLITGCSFAFFVRSGVTSEDDGDSWVYDRIKRTTTRYLKPGGCRELSDVSVVLNPAYKFDGVTMSQRSVHNIEDDYMAYEIARISKKIGE